MYIPEILLENTVKIRKINVNEHLEILDMDRWIEAIPEISDILSELSIKISKNKISRNTISSIFPNNPKQPYPCNQKDKDKLLAFFILVMMWGYGNIGYGPWRVKKMISSPNFIDTLCKVSEECYYGLFLKAYNTLIKNINKLGPAFASKYLYFFCKNFNATVKPLIFDSMVIKTMRTFNWPSWCINFMANKNTPNNNSYAYGQYLILMHNWAYQLNCKPDQIEYYLWTKGLGIPV